MSKRVEIQWPPNIWCEGIVISDRKGRFLVLTDVERKRLQRIVDIFVFDTEDRKRLFDLLDGNDEWEEE